MRKAAFIILATLAFLLDAFMAFLVLAVAYTS